MMTLDDYYRDILEPMVANFKEKKMKAIFLNRSFDEWVKIEKEWIEFKRKEKSATESSKPTAETIIRAYQYLLSTKPAEIINALLKHNYKIIDADLYDVVDKRQPGLPRYAEITFSDGTKSCGKVLAIEWLDGKKE